MYRTADTWHESSSRDSGWGRKPGAEERRWRQDQQQRDLDQLQCLPVSTPCPEPQLLCSDEDSVGGAELVEVAQPSLESGRSVVGSDWVPLQPTCKSMARPPSSASTGFDMHHASVLTSALVSTLAMQQLGVVTQMVNEISSLTALQGHLSLPLPPQPQSQVPMVSVGEAILVEEDGSGPSLRTASCSSSPRPSHVGSLQPMPPPYPPPQCISIDEDVEDEAIAVRIQLDTIGGTISSDNDVFMQRAFDFIREQNQSIVKIEDDEALDLRDGRGLDEDEYVLPVDEVYFMQRNIGSRFRDGHSLEETIAQLSERQIHPLRNAFLTLRVWHVCGRFFSVDNRRLFCMKWHQKQLRLQSGCEAEVVSVRAVLFGQFKNWRDLQMLLRRFDTDSDGCNVRIRQRRS